MAHAGQISYCRAYLWKDLAEFPGLPEEIRSALGSDAVCYLHEDLRVTAGPSIEDNVLFDRITDDWRAFCSNKLAFAVPPDISGPESS